MKNGPTVRFEPVAYNISNSDFFVRRCLLENNNRNELITLNPHQEQFDTVSSIENV